MTSMIMIYRLNLIHIYLVFLACLGLGELIYQQDITERTYPLHYHLNFQGKKLEAPLVHFE